MATIADILLAARANQDAGRFDQVESLCREVLAVAPNLAEAHALLAESLVGRDAFDEALGHYRQVLCLQPDHVPTHLNLGCMLERTGWIEEAIACYRNGLRIAPDLAQAHQHLGRALCEQGRTEAAVACFERAMTLDPDWAVPRLGRAHARLMEGDFERGWDDYEWRDAAQPGTWQASELPRWDGARAADKTVWISAEQGLGTEILFASCIADAANDVGHAILECDPRLRSLFERSFPEVTVVPKPSDEGGAVRPSGAELHIPLGSLPCIYRRSETDFPRRSQYLAPDPALCHEWALRLARLGGGPKIGISWRGGSSTEKMLKRSAPLNEWLPILRVPGANWVNVQYGPCDELLRKMRDAYGVIIHDWEDLDQTRDMDNMAALLSELDLIISVNNSAVHLAAALGSPVWLLLPLAADWRWMIRRQDSPWHPSIRIFRQTVRREWADVFGLLHTEVTRIVRPSRDAA